MSKAVRSTRQKYIVALTILMIATLAGSAGYLGVNRVSIDKLPDYIKNGEYEKVVKAYNRQASGNIDREKKYNKTIKECMSRCKRTNDK